MSSGTWKCFKVEPFIKLNIRTHSESNSYYFNNIPVKKKLKVRIYVFLFNEKNLNITLIQKVH